MKKYKYGNQVLEEDELRENLDNGLGLLISTSRTILAELALKGYKREEAKVFENIDYEHFFNAKFIDLLNKKWDKKMAKQREKNEKAIQENDIKFFIKDISGGIKSIPKLDKSVKKLFNMAAKSNDERYSHEILKFVDKCFSESEEYYQQQRDYNKQFIKEDVEVE